MKMSRTWAMPTSKTFTCKPIGEFVQKYLTASAISIDPFARNCQWATYTNDLNSKTVASYHMDALDFLEMLQNRGIQANLIIFDPPYSPRQMKECYNSIGLKMRQRDGWRTHSWRPEKEVVDKLLLPDGVFLQFGWDTCGMGKKRGYVIEEIMMVCHGAGHSDTICMAERKPL